MIRSPIALVASLAFAPLALAPACDSQTDSDYRGETLVQLRGVVTTSTALDLRADLEVMIAWDYDHGEGDQILTQTAKVSGAFPARFTLDITEPPPDAVLGSENVGSRGALGYIVVAPTGMSIDDVVERDGVPAGIATGYMLVYSERAIAPNTMSALKVGGPLSAGYSLLAVTQSAEFIAAHPEAAACDDFLSGCDDPDEGGGVAAWDAYEACEYAARKDANCLYNESSRDQLSPAPEGFETEIRVTLVNSGDELQEQGPEIH